MCWVGGVQNKRASGIGNKKQKNASRILSFSGARLLKHRRFFSQARERTHRKLKQTSQEHPQVTLVERRTRLMDKYMMQQYSSVAGDFGD